MAQSTSTTTSSTPTSCNQDRFNSKEKQAVRNKLWMPFYKDTCRTADPVGKIKYLCFPGLGSHFIKQLIGAKLVFRDETQIVGIEQDPFTHKDIFKFFSAQFDQGRYEIMQGKYEVLIGEDKLISWFTKKPYGFDIIELDFPTPLFSLDKNRRSKLLEAIAKTLKVQAFFGRNYHLFLTFKCDTPVSGELKAQYGTGCNMLSKEILAKENLLLNNGKLTSLITSLANSPTERQIDECTLFAAPLAVIRRAEGICSIALEEVPYTHVSQSVGGRSRLISYAFKCQPRDFTVDCAGQCLFEDTKKRLQIALDKIEKTVWVN